MKMNHETITKHFKRYLGAFGVVLIMVQFSVLSTNLGELSKPENHEFSERMIQQFYAAYNLDMNKTCNMHCGCICCAEVIN